MAGDFTYGRTLPLHRRPPRWWVYDDRAVRPLRGQPSRRLQVARALRRRRPRRPARPEPRAAPLLTPRRRRRRRAPLRGTPEASRLGPREAARLAPAAAPGRRLARREHRGRPAQAPGTRDAAPPPLPRDPSRRRPAHDARAERPVDGGLQGPV